MSVFFYEEQEIYVKDVMSVGSSGELWEERVEGGGNRVGESGGERG